MGWIDSTAWDPTQGKPLVQLLAEHYPNEALVRALLENAQIPVRFLRTGNVSMELYWRGLAEDLHNNHLLRALVDQAALDTPAIAAQLAAFDQVDAERDERRGYSEICRSKCRDLATREPLCAASSWCAPRSPRCRRSVSPSFRLHRTL